ncbi:HAUS augmin-like complex subunit 6 N-terminus-domain-containing protein [Mucor mucedo]|uniref:HAUS augmin-like complex subunit 6 N-terminus-domain-containing protein n=1 Tax=Mucor mucedo TaxID=29922 RepID=UPI00221F30A9|nr:HAUS augmin-like complex subunit 6 N-terminus-domain-containing protein [Mucor mucedo]KAI7893103.1 HAUS augmin-like complex subunit 6 N-terminus-domain-containing protein [Mucor mucedo]
MSRKSIRSSAASTFVRNLHSLGFKPPRNSKWVVNQQTFTVNADSIKAFEHVSYFLFSILDKKKVKSTFREVWPITNIEKSREYRRLAFKWLKDIQPGTHLVNAPLRVSYFTDCRGKPFNQIISAFTALAMDKNPNYNTDVATNDSYSAKTAQDSKPHTAGKRSTIDLPLTTEVLPRKKTRTQSPVDLPKSSLNATPRTCPQAVSHSHPLQNLPALLISVPSSSKPKTSPTFNPHTPSGVRSLISSSLPSSKDTASSRAYQTPPSNTDVLLSSKSDELASSTNNHLPHPTESPFPP